MSKAEKPATFDREGIFKPVNVEANFGEYTPEARELIKRILNVVQEIRMRQLLIVDHNVTENGVEIPDIDQRTSLRVGYEEDREGNPDLVIELKRKIGIGPFAPNVRGLIGGFDSRMIRLAPDYFILADTIQRKPPYLQVSHWVNRTPAGERIQTTETAVHTISAYREPLRHVHRVEVDPPELKERVSWRGQIAIVDVPLIASKLLTLLPRSLRGLIAQDVLPVVRGINTIPEKRMIVLPDMSGLNAEDVLKDVRAHLATFLRRKSFG